MPIPKWEDSTPIDDIPKYEDSVAVGDAPKYEDSKPAAPSFTPDISNLTVKPPKLAEFTPEQIQSSAPVIPALRNLPAPPMPKVGGIQMAGDLTPGSVDTLQQAEEERARAQFQQIQEPVKKVLFYKPFEAEGAAIRKTAAGLEPPVPTASPLAMAGSTAAGVAQLAGGAIQHATVLDLMTLFGPKAASMITESNWFRKLAISERALVVQQLSDDQIIKMAQGMSHKARREFVAGNPRARTLFTQGPEGPISAERTVADVASGAPEPEPAGIPPAPAPAAPTAQPRPPMGSFEGTVLEFKIKTAMGLKPADHLTDTAINAAFAAGKIPQDLAEQMGHPGALQVAAEEAAKNAPPAPALDPASQQMAPEQDVESRQEAISQPHPRTGQPVYAMSESDFSAAMREVAPEMSPETISKRYQALLSESKDLKLVDDREIAQLNDPKLAEESKIAQAAGEMLPEDHEFNFMDAGPASLSAMSLEELRAKFPGMSEQLHRELVVEGLNAGQILPEQAPYADIKKAAIDRVNQDQLNVEKRQAQAGDHPTPILQMLWKRKLNRAGAQREGIDLGAMRGYFTEKGGMTIEQATENAYEMGWILEYDQALFLEAMDKELMRKEGVIRSPEAEYKPGGQSSLMYHGTSAADFKEFKGGVVYLSGSAEEAGAFAGGGILGGGRGTGSSRVLSVRVPDGPSESIDAIVQETIMNDGDLDAVIAEHAALARKRGIEYLTFNHPGVSGEDFEATVAVNPEKLKIVRTFLASPGQEYTPAPAPAFYSTGEMPVDLRDLFSMQSGEGGKYSQPAWHGSPHDFDKFLLHKIGTGEGAQAYGWGLYFAGDKAVAEYYKKSLSSREDVAFEKDGVKLSTGIDMLREYFKPDTIVHGYSGMDKVVAFHDGIKEGTSWYVDVAEVDRNNKVIGRVRRHGTMPSGREFNEVLGRDGWKRTTGKLYEVNIPDSDKMLDWDKKLSEQYDKSKLFKDAFEKISKEHPQLNMDVKGNILYGYLEDRLGSPEAVSKYLNSLGITGIKYLDSSSRSKITVHVEKILGNNTDYGVFEGAVGVKMGPRLKVFKTESEAKDYADKNNNLNHNYVIFDDNLVQIVNKYSQPGAKYAPGHVYTPGEMLTDEAGAGADTALAVTDTRRVRPVGQYWTDIRPNPAIDGINKQTMEKGFASAVGMRIDTIQDVAEIDGFCVRHPGIEHYAVTKLKDGKITGSLVLTSGKVGWFDIDVYRDVIDKFLSTDCDEFYDTHGHPSGDSTPSVDDIKATKRMAADKRYKGHVVTNHKTYTAIMPDGTAIAQEFRNEKQSFRKDIEQMSWSPAVVGWAHGSLQGDKLGIMFVDVKKQVMSFDQVDPRSNYNAYIQRNASKYGAVGVFLVTGDAAFARMTPRVLSGSYYDLLVIGADGQYRSAALGHLPGFSIDLADTQKFPELEGVFGANRLAETPADYHPEDYQNIIGRFKPGMKLTLRSRFTSAQFPKGLPRGSEFELKAVAKTGEMLVTYQGRVVAMILNPSLFKETYRAPIVRAPVIPEATWLRGMERAGSRDTGLPPTETTALVNAELPPGEKVNVWGDIIKYYMGTKRERFQAMAGSVEKGDNWYNAVRQMAVNLSSVKKMVEARNKEILGSIPKEIREQVHNIVKGISMSPAGEVIGGGIQPAGVVQGKMLQVGQELPDNRIIGNEIEPGVYQIYRFFNTLGDYKTMVAEHPETVKFFKAFLATSELLDKTKLGQELPAFSREVMKSQYDIRTVHPTGYLWVPSVKPEQKFFTKIGNLFKSYVASGRKYKTGILAERGGENKDLLKTLTEKQVDFAYENIYNNTVGDILSTILEPIGSEGVKPGFIEVNLNKPKLAAIIELKRGLLLANGIDVAKISEYQYPMDIEKEFNLQRTAKFNPARQAVVDDMKKRTNEFVGYILTNYLIRPSTAVRNLTSGFMQYNLRTLTHFYEGMLGEGLMPAVNDIKALATSLLPSVRQEIPAEMLGINFFSEIPGNLNLMNKALGPFKAVEVFFKRASFDSDLSTLAGKAYDTVKQAGGVKWGDKAQFIHDWRINYFQDVFNFLSDNSDSVTFDYGNKPYFLEKMSNSIGRGMVPFPNYLYHKWRMYSEYSPMQLVGMDKTNYKNKISKMMAGMTMFAIGSIIASGLVEDRRRRLKKLEIKKLPWEFDTTGRIKVYADDEVERWLRIYDLPFIGDSVYMLEILNGLSSVEDWMKDTLSMGPIFNSMAMVAGFKSKYTTGSPTSAIAGQQVAGFIPFGAYMQYVRMVADPVKRKTFANNYSAFEDFINPIIDAVPGASKMLSPQIGKTGAEKGHIRKYDIPGQTMSFFFLNIRSIDKQEYKQYMIDQYMSGKVQKRIEKETLKKAGVPPR